MSCWKSLREIDGAVDADRVGADRGGTRVAAARREERGDRETGDDREPKRATSAATRPRRNVRRSCGGRCYRRPSAGAISASTNRSASAIEPCSSGARERHRDGAVHDTSSPARCAAAALPATCAARGRRTGRARAAPRPRGSPRRALGPQPGDVEQRRRGRRRRAVAVGPLGSHVVDVGGGRDRGEAPVRLHAHVVARDVVARQVRGRRAGRSAPRRARRPSRR